MQPSLPPNHLPASTTPFGHNLRALWSLDPAIHFLNHGSFGATPRHVQAAQSRWREEMENEPVRFMLDTLPAALLIARARLAEFVGASLSRLAFVENATAGVNAVLRAAGSSREQVLRVTVYLSDISYWGQVNAVYAEFFGAHRPARTMVPVGKLHHGYEVGMDAVAAVG